MLTKRRFHIGLLLVALGFTILSIIVALAGTKETLSLIGKNWEVAILVFIFEMLIILVWSLRWLYVMRYFDRDYRLKSSIGVTATMTFVNNITPGDKSGGEVIKGYATKKHKNHVTSADISSGLFTEKLIEIILILPLLFTFFVYFLFTGFPAHKFAFIAILSLVTIATILIFIFIYNKNFLTNFFAKRITKIAPKNWDPKKNILYFKAKTQELFKNKVAVFSIIFSICYWGLELLRPYFVLSLLGEDVELHKVVITLILANSISSFSGIPGGVGAQESIRVVLYTTYVGIPADVAAAAVFIERIVPFLIAIIFGGSIVSTVGVKIIQKNNAESKESDDKEDEKDIPNFRLRS